MLALGFFQSAHWATDLWPWSDTPLSFIFIASILAAIALPALWIGVSGELAAIQAGGLELSITYGAIFVYLLTLAGDPRAAGPRPLPGRLRRARRSPASLSSSGAAGSRGATGARCRSVVRGSFAFLALVLVAAGTALAFGADIFPWELRSETSVIFGFIYLGAAVYFLYGFVRPRWSNAAGQLIGFLAYDIVLIGAFVDRFDEVTGRQLLSLIIYSAVLVFSGALAFYYLFVSDGPGSPATPSRTHGRRTQSLGFDLVSTGSLSASKIRFAPGISPGFGAAYDHFTSPSSISTSERLAWPTASIQAP